MSKPRIFVSSTYYDLKYVRERIEHFINAYCFEPVLFESDDVYFQPNKPLDTSCYNEVSNCHMMILIVGGRYGSLATEEKKEHGKDEYEKQYVSITRKEYETAIKKGIPVMIFVEQNVYTEYRTYLTNKNSLPKNFKFAYVDDVKIFEFISILEQNAIKSFNKVDDIEHYFAHQISGMLLAYLIELQQKEGNREITNVVEQINVISQSMQTMLNSIGEKVLGGEQQEKYKELLKQQNQSLIDFFFDSFRFSIHWKKDNYTYDRTHSDMICKIFMSTLFCKDKIEPIEKDFNYLSDYPKLKELEQKCSDKIKSDFLNLSVKTSIYSHYQQLFKIINLIYQDQDNDLKTYFEDKLRHMIDVDLSCPF